MAVRKKVANDPWIRSLHMRVHEDGPRGFMVIGGSVPHHVSVVRGVCNCDCIAGVHGNFCAHVAAVTNHLKEEKNKMGLQLDKSSKGESKYPVSLPRKQKQLYGGIFSGWWMSEEGQYGPSLVVKALVTHAPAGSKGWEKVEHITMARAYLGVSQWHNAKKNQSSYPVAFLAAASGVDPAQLAEMPVAEFEGLLNECVGNGILFSASVEQTTKGHMVNSIDKKTFDAPDESFGRLADAMRPRLVISVSESDQSRYVSKPEPEYQKEEEPGSHLTGDPVDDLDDQDHYDDEIPF